MCIADFKQCGITSTKPEKLIYNITPFINPS